MKKFYIVVILFFGFSVIGNAQSSCVRNISTNPLNPINEEWGTVIFPGISDYYLNSGFNWYPPQFGPVTVIDPSQNWATPYSSQNNPIYMKSPFRTENGHGSKYLWDQLTDVEDADFWWEDGWELLFMNLGIYPNGNKINIEYQDHWLNYIKPDDGSVNYYTTGPTPDNAPYFILYNKYRGILRVFANVWFTDNSVGTQEDITVELVLDGSTPDQNKEQSFSGVFRLANGLDQALDKPTEIISLVSPRRHPGGSSNTTQWVAADFQVAYDPCQCYTPTKFDIRFSKREKLIVNLALRTISYDRDLNDLNDDEQNFFQSMVDADGNVIAPGNVAYASLNTLMEDYKKAMDKYGAELKDYNSPINALKKGLVEMLQTTISGGVLNPLQYSNDLLKFIQDNQLPLWSDEAKKEASKELAKEVVKTGKKVLASQFDFLNATLGVTDKPIKPQIPQATFSEGRIAGIIKRSFFEPGGPFFVPGTVPTAGINPNLIEAHNFPAYNNVMGMFALMKTPEQIFFDSGYQSTSETEPIGGASFQVELGAKRKFVFIPSGIEYAINEALDWDSEKTNFLVSYVFEFEQPIKQSKLELLETFLGDNSNFEIQHRLTSNLNGSQITVTTIVGSEYYNIEEIKNKVFSFELNMKIKDDDIYSSYNLQNNVDHRENIWTRHELKSIKMKVIADMYFDQLSYPTSDGEQVNTFQVRTFELYNKDKPGSLEEQLRGEIVEEYQSWANYLPGTTVLDGEIAHTDPRVKEINNATNTLIIRAENVEVTGEVKPESGYNLRIEAMTDIKVLEGGKLLPNVTATIVPDFYGNGANPPATTAEVSAFCSGTNPVYGANNPGKRAQEVIAANERERLERAKREGLQIQTYPNPASAFVQISVQNQPQQITEVGLVLSDLTGRQILQETQAANAAGRYVLNLPQLPTGVYMLHVTAGDKTAVEKIVVR